MRTLQGTWYGAVMDDNRTSLSGWTEMSYTASTARVTNQPVVWNDRPNRLLMNQTWFRLERSVVTSGTTDVTWGYRIDADYGTDYRFSMMRGFLNNELKNANGTQNLYGIDLIQFYSNSYIPTLFQGTDVRAGRLFTPWGAESLEGISTPFVSRSYAFNWSPPFTHMGIMVSPTFNANWSGKFMLANGNDVFIGSSAQELRAVGAITPDEHQQGGHGHLRVELRPGQVQHRHAVQPNHDRRADRAGRAEQHQRLRPRVVSHL